MKRLFGGLLLAAGVLIAGASGLCVLIFFGEETTGGGYFATLAGVLIVGGIPFGIGTGLFLAGRALLRSAGDQLPEA